MKTTLRFEPLEARDVPATGSTLQVIGVEPDFTLSLNSTGRVAVMQLAAPLWPAFSTGTQTMAQNQAITKAIYRYFPDQFDYIFAVDNLPDTTTGLFGFNAPVSNKVTGIGQPAFDNSAQWGSNGKLQSFLWLGSEQDVYRRTILHEMLHLDANFLPQLHSTDPSHWGFSSVGGLLGGWAPGTLRQIGPNTYDADSPTGATDWYTNTTAFPYDQVVGYSQLELYLWGLIDASQVDPVQYATNPAWVNPLNQYGVSAFGQFTADSIQTLTIQNIVAQEGLRFPTPATSQKSYRGITVVLTPNPITQAELDQFDTDVELFSRVGSDGDPTNYNFWEATGGRATIQLDGLLQYLPSHQQFLGLGTNGQGQGLTIGTGGKYDSVVFPSFAPYLGVGPDQSLRVAVGDVDGDNIPDFAVATGPGSPTRFAVISGDQTHFIIPPTAPFLGSADFSGGAFVSVGDFDGDGRDDVVISPDVGGGPRVTIFSFKPGVGTYQLANFFGIADSSFRGGVRTAVGDVNHDGRVDLAVAAGPGGGPRVAIYNGATIFTSPTKLVNDFFAYTGSDAINLRNGIYVAIGDVSGDGWGDLITGAGEGGAPRVIALSGQLLINNGVAVAQASPLADFFSGNVTDRGGVRVAIKDVDRDTRLDIVTGSGANLPGDVRVYKGNTLRGRAQPPVFQDLPVFGNLALEDGVYVG
jgi:hypothetical protein